MYISGIYWLSCPPLFSYVIAKFWFRFFLESNILYLEVGK